MFSRLEGLVIPLKHILATLTLKTKTLQTCENKNSPEPICTTSVFTSKAAVDLIVAPLLIF